MILPQIPNIDRTREYTQEFKGYNHNLRIAENEFYDDYNVSADNYPVLSTRKKRNRISEGFNGKLCGAVGRGEDLYYVLYDKKGQAKLYKRDKDGKSTSLPVELDGNNTTRQMLFFGSYLLIYPDSKYINIGNFQTGGMEFPVDWRELERITITLQKEGTDNTYQDFKLHAITSRLPNRDNTAELDGEFHAEIQADNTIEIFQLKAERNQGDGDWRYEYAYLQQNMNDFRLKIEIETSYEISEKIGLNFAECHGTASPRGPGTESLLDENFEFVDDVVKWDGKTLYIGGAIMGYSKIVIENDKITGYLGQSDENTVDLSVCPIEFRATSTRNGLFGNFIECQNRLWATYCGKTQAGTLMNQICYTALGTFDDWTFLDAVAASGGTISVGTPGAFTGAAVINQNPVFFKEDYIHKVYVSGSGAHQVLTLECQGLQESSNKSLALVNGYIFYKTRNDVVLFDGTSITSISSALGDMKYENAVAGVSGNKYVMYCENGDKGFIFTYDTKTGIWHRETAPDSAIVDMTVCDGKLYMISNAIDVHDDESGNESVPFMFESGDIGFSTPDKKYISRIDLRLSLEFGARMRFWMQYDSDGNWIESGTLHGMDMTHKLISLPILPRRCDHFRIKVTGIGKFNLYAITKILEQGE